MCSSEVCHTADTTVSTMTAAKCTIQVDRGNHWVGRNRRARLMMTGVAAAQGAQARVCVNTRVNQECCMPCAYMLTKVWIPSMKPRVPQTAQIKIHSRVRTFSDL